MKLIEGLKILVSPMILWVGKKSVLFVTKHAKDLGLLSIERINCKYGVIDKFMTHFKGEHPECDTKLSPKCKIFMLLLGIMP